MKELLNIVPCSQGDSDWFMARCGCITSSRAADAVAVPKSEKRTEPLAVRTNLLWDIVTERLTGKHTEHYVSDAMKWGIENEARAVAAYENEMDTLAERVGYVLHPDRERLLWAGASPDGLLEDGVLECKCPTTRVHLQYLKAGVFPEQYLPQCHWIMANCPGCQYVDLASFDPRLPKDLQLFVKRLERDEKVIARMEAEVEKFLAEVEIELLVLRERGALAGALKLSIAKARAGLEITEQDIAKSLRGFPGRPVRGIRRGRVSADSKSWQPGEGN